jgi:hypothetical protein
MIGERGLDVAVEEVLDVVPERLVRDKQASRRSIEEPVRAEVVAVKSPVAILPGLGESPRCDVGAGAV